MGECVGERRGTVIKGLDNDGLLAGAAPREDNDDLAGLDAAKLAKGGGLRFGGVGGREGRARGFPPRF